MSKCKVINCNNEEYGWYDGYCQTCHTAREIAQENEKILDAQSSEEEE